MNWSLNYFAPKLLLLLDLSISLVKCIKHKVNPRKVVVQFSLLLIWFSFNKVHSQKPARLSPPCHTIKCIMLMYYSVDDDNQDELFPKGEYHLSFYPVQSIKAVQFILSSFFQNDNSNNNLGCWHGKTTHFHIKQGSSSGTKGWNG